MSQKERHSEIDAIIGENLRRIRRYRNLSQHNLAEEIGVTFQQIQKYEQGKSRITCSTAYTLSKALKVPLNEFFRHLTQEKSKVSIKLQRSTPTVYSAISTRARKSKKQ